MMYTKAEMERAEAHAMHIGRKAGLHQAAAFVMDESCQTWRGIAGPDGQKKYDDARAHRLRHISDQLSKQADAAEKEAGAV